MWVYNNIVPPKNSIKVNVKDGFYHIYNRGVAKQRIYNEQQDYHVFLNYLKQALSPPQELNDLSEKTVNVQGTSFSVSPRLPLNFINDIDLLAYCLMPNHFHLLIQQRSLSAMQGLMRSLLTRYSTYFNKKYDRVGPLFQGRYQAILINTEPYLLHLSRYIHLNPSETVDNIVSAFSSYSDYLGLKRSKWVKPDIILSYFDNSTIPEVRRINTYKNFVEKYQRDSSRFLGEYTLE